MLVSVIGALSKVTLALSTLALMVAIARLFVRPSEERATEQGAQVFRILVICVCIGSFGTLASWAYTAFGEYNEQIKELLENIGLF